MRRRTSVLLWLIVLLGAFLIGFVPQYQQKRQARADLAAANEKLSSIHTELKMAELRDLSGRMLVQVLLRNYGLAQDLASQYFNKLREAADQAHDPRAKNKLQDLLAMRDAITAALAQGDPTTSSEIQTLFTKTYEATRHQ